MRIRLAVIANPWQTSHCSSVVEHFLGKEEVVSSILINGSDSWNSRMTGKDLEKGRNGRIIKLPAKQIGLADWEYLIFKNTI